MVSINVHLTEWPEHVVTYGNTISDYRQVPGQPGHSGQLRISGLSGMSELNKLEFFKHFILSVLFDLP